MKPHPDYKELLEIWPNVLRFQDLASRHGINDVFQDNGGKLLQILLLTGLSGLGAREGNDAKDTEGFEYELKSVNLNLTTQVSTHHHLNPTIINKYRNVTWVFALYHSIELHEIWIMKPSQLEPWFTEKEEKWKSQGDLNNPKIPVKFVRENGVLYYPFKNEA